MHESTEVSFEQPILNSPYSCPTRHWELDQRGQPTGNIVECRRTVDFVTPIRRPKRVRAAKGTPQATCLDDPKGLSAADPQYELAATINRIRDHVDRWRSIPDPARRQITPETARLLHHWRHHPFNSIRPFFCQIEAVETAIWLTEVAPNGPGGRGVVQHLDDVNRKANPGLNRLALKLATGAGKTTVMAMLIAWQTVNAVRHPNSKKFTRGFLVVTPGLTIRDRLRVLLPGDPDSYYTSRELVPTDMLGDLRRAKIVITNYHAFKLRERIELSKGGRLLLEGRSGSELNTLETEGQMLRRVMPQLMGIRNVLAFNDEAHHCYRERASGEQDVQLNREEKKEAQANNRRARLWVSGLEAVARRLGLPQVFDLSATPFFLRGSGYAEGTLFPWTACDYSLMDSIECGIVKVPRVPVAIPGSGEPEFNDLWDHVRAKMPTKGRRKAVALDPLGLPVELQAALKLLYGHYEKTFKLWESAGINVPPCFIVVCNNTSASRLVYDFISGFHKDNEDGELTYFPGRLALFCNFDAEGKPLGRRRSLLIDSRQVETGDALDESFRAMAADEIVRIRRDIIERTGDPRQAEHLKDPDLLREVVNTVGKPGRLGEQIRCVVSVAMLTEGWDANTVTHVLGVRAFGTQLVCEQVLGRALRRQSYDLNRDGLFNVEYADVLGIPFDFTAKPVVAPPHRPREITQVKAIRPDRDALEIAYPRVEGYRVELPEDCLIADFNEDSLFRLTPNLVAQIRDVGMISEAVTQRPDRLKELRQSTILMHLTKYLLFTRYRDPCGEPELHLFGKLWRVTREWLDTCLACDGDTYPSLLLYKELADMACERITAGITRARIGERRIHALINANNPAGSTFLVNFNTSKKTRWLTAPLRSHINWVILDNEWEAEVCRSVECHPRVRAYVKNHNLGFEVPYRCGSEVRRYRPDFILRLDDGHGNEDLLNLVVEIKGYSGEDAKEKKSAMEAYWLPGVNNLAIYGRWAFVELDEVHFLEGDFKGAVEAAVNKALDVEARSHDGRCHFEPEVQAFRKDKSCLDDRSGIPLGCPVA